MAEKSKIIVRPATPMDSVNLVKLIKAGYAETPAAQVAEFDEQQFLEYVTQSMKANFAIVADLDGRIVGCYGMAPVRVQWCKDLIMVETWFAVQPTFRQKGVPERLLAAAERFLDQEKRAVVGGTQMLTPWALNTVYEDRDGYIESRKSFIRMPMAVKAKAAAS